MVDIDSTFDCTTDPSSCIAASGATSNPADGASYSPEEEKAMMMAHVVKGVIWVLYAYAPMTYWYSRTSRKAIIRDKDENSWYFWTMNILVYGHFLVFTLPAFLFPFTFLDNSTVNRFYILVGYWIGSMLGSAVYTVVTFMFLLTLVTHNDLPSASRTFIAVQMALYALFTWGSFIFSALYLNDATNKYL